MKGLVVSIDASRPSFGVVSAAGVLVAVSAVLALAALVGSVAPILLLALSDIGLALGVGALVLGSSGAVGPSRVAGVVLLLFGAGPLIYRLESLASPPSVALGTLTFWLVTAATIGSAVLVARAGCLRGLARWTLLLVAADALLTALLSSVPAEALSLIYLNGPLEALRPVALLAWGIGLMLQNAAARDHGRSVVASWKRTTDVGGSQG